MAMQPRFSEDFTKLVYFGRETKFLSHTSNYQLMMIPWPTQANPTSSETLIDRIAEYPSDDQEFAGLYGYHENFT
jgi:hypothetical protein